MNTFPFRKTLPPLFLILALVALCAGPARAQGNAPPAPVVTAEVGKGAVTPYTEFVGTVYFAEVSSVATEIAGRVDAVDFQEGQRVKAGQVLVTLNSELLQLDFQSMQSSFGETAALLEEAEIEYGRMEKLIQSGSISQQEYDEKRFNLKSLRGKADSLQAELNRLALELKKTLIKSPFDGLVLNRLADNGEWLATGAPVAEIARLGALDVVVDVPQNVFAILAEGTEVKAKAAGNEYSGKVRALISRGDVATRTFPVKIALKKPKGLAEGMQAAVSLPTGTDQETLVVPRDAIISFHGTTVVFAVVDGKATMIPVTPTGYKGMLAGVVGQGLTPGMQVVVKGNERLRPGQPVAAEK